MRCYKCGSVLSETDYCNSCGADVAIYKKIIRLSNTYYNMGLEKARLRDLSGAADLLRRSVRMNKKNIQARNLLGLVYYEMGEFVEALSQWVISKNIKPEKNIADEYIKEVQENPTRLEAMNTTIKKYNAALNYALDDSDDLAIIQLKKVVSLNPKLVKAYQLLALLYMKKEEYQRATRYLKKALAIDKNNTLGIKYLKEIEKKTAENSESSRKNKSPQEREKKALSGNDVIIPETGYKDINYGVMQFITIIIGILIGAAMVYFLVTPAKENRATADYEDTINDYSNDISRLNMSINELQQQVSALETEKESLQAQVDEAAKQGDIAASYDTLVRAAELYAGDDKVGCALMLMDMGEVTGRDENYMALYEALKNDSYQEAYRSSYNDAYKAENSSRYQDAIDSFLICEKVQPENLEILYHLGKNYYNLNNGEIDANAEKYFNRVIELSPNSKYAGWAHGYLD